MTTAIPPAAVRATTLGVLVADADPESGAQLSRALEAAGHRVLASVTTSGEAVTRSAALSPDVVVIDLGLPDATGAATAALIRRGLPAAGVVLMASDAEAVLTDEEMVATGAVALLAKPVPSLTLECTVRLAATRARELATVREAASAARRQLEERKLIERAKGILMRRTGTSEQEAYRILQRSSQDRGTPMAVLAQAVLDSEPGAVRAH
jgi:response regulator NasT